MSCIIDHSASKPKRRRCLDAIQVFPFCICSSCSDPLGGVKNLQVIDPTISTLTARWDPAVGNVRSYKVFYAAQPGGEERMVRAVLDSFRLILKVSCLEQFQ